MARMVSLLALDAALSELLAGVLYTWLPKISPLRSRLGLEVVRALYRVFVMSVSPPLLLGSCLGSRLGRVLVLSVSPPSLPGSCLGSRLGRVS